LNESNQNTGGAQGTQQGNQRSLPDQSQTPNPLRSLGDARREVLQRLEEILQQEQDSSQPSRQDQSSAQIEYLNPEDEDQDMQALGPAGNEQIAKLDQLRIVEEDVKDQAAMDVDDASNISPEAQDLTAESLPLPSQIDTVTERREGVEGAIPHMAPYAPDGLSINPGTEDPTSRTDQDRANDETIEAELRSWQAAGLPDSNADHIWQLYGSLTNDLAFALCEQLRLILEPTQATRLKGDYRTGKRLNMKKIIPYIASDFTKDKIWLRRTKPSQREYQVLIALDDSRSMAESHSVHLAYQTLALVSKALSRLEVGDIGIARFGETVDVLHDFDGAPFSDQAGSQVMQAFKFTQKATDVLSLLNTSLQVLESAREKKSMSSASAADLWQLEIIISDGMCQDHERLRSVLRKAEEQRIMVVFIIIDSLHQNAGSAAQGSILSMERAEFKNVEGRMELQLQRYLDSFPFEYYVVLRNVESLPDVLSGTLKQFFERISEE
jgi:midasin